jgi:hypothetical protein
MQKGQFIELAFFILSKIQFVPRCAPSCIAANLWGWKQAIAETSAWSELIGCHEIKKQTCLRE